MALLASPLPEVTGAVTLVVSSIFEAPLSDPAAKSGADGATGAVVSTVTLNAVEGKLELPAESVAMARSAWTPSTSAETVKDQLPLPSAVVEPTLPSRSLVTSTSLSASAVPEMSGVLSLVTLSVFDAPLSDPEARSSPLGVEGADVPMMMSSGDEATLVFPAASVAVAVSE